LRRWKRRRGSRPVLECLEQRLVLATFTPGPGIAEGLPNSLRDVISQANSNGEDDVIVLTTGRWDAGTGNDPLTGQDNLNLSGDFDLVESGYSITFQGAGAGSTVIDPGGFDRTFHVFSGVRAIFRDLSIVNSRAVDSGIQNAAAGDYPAFGGAILVQGGDLELDGVHLRGNIAIGADGQPGFDGKRSYGGAVAVFDGSATIRNSLIDNNRAKGGEGGEGPNGRAGTGNEEDGENGEDGGGGGQANGGGLYARNSDVTVDASAFTLNQADGGGGGAGGRGGNGAEGGTGGRAGSGGQGGPVMGGGLFLDSGSLTVTTSVFEGNVIEGGRAGGGGRASESGPSGGIGTGPNGSLGGSSNIGGWAQGGGISVAFGQVTISASSVMDNDVRGGDGTDGGIGGRGGLSDGGFGGAGGSGGHGGEGGFVQGGGIFIQRGILDATDSTIARNRIVAGVGGVGGPGGRAGESTGGDPFGGSAGNGGRGGGGGDSEGGGLFSLNVDLSLTNSTISSNRSERGRGGAGGDEGTPSGNGLRGRVGSDGRDGVNEGGGLWTDDATQALIQSVTIAGNQALEGDGSGVFNDGSVAVELNSVIVAANHGDDDYVGRIAADSSNNVIGNGARVVGITHNTDANQIGDTENPIDVLLGALQDNGGPTLTHALHEGSPAIDAGLRDVTPEFDQRGVLRPLQSPVDAGAFEAQRQLSVTLPDGGGDYRLIRDGDEIVIARDVVDGEEVFRYQFTALFSVTLETSAHPDRLIVDISGGQPLPPGGVLFDSVAGVSDSVEIVGPESLSEVAYELSSPGTGSAYVDGRPVSWEDVQSVVDHLSAASRVVQFGSQDDIATLTDGADAGTSRILHGSASVTMTNPTASLLVNGGDGADVLSIDVLDSGLSATVTIDGQAGDDLLDAANVTRRVVLLGSDGADSLRGGRFDDTIDGGDGNDKLLGRGGDDLISGAGGNDYISGDGGNDVASGGDGDDKVTGGAGRDTLSGDAGNDRVLGQGGSGDWISGGDGNDTLNGGNGTDVVKESGNVNFRLTSNRLYGRGTDRIFLVERAHLTGGDGNNTLDIRSFDGSSATLDGGAGDDQLRGSGGRDLLRGGAGNDVISGNAGNDVIFGGLGSDVLDGGAGNDVVKGFEGADSLTGGRGNDSLLGGDGDDRLSGGIDNDLLQGDAGNDELTGDSGDDTLNGGDDADRLDGMAGADVINGGDGDDFAWGGDGNDTLSGDGGHDRLFGDAGFDVVSGGDGADDLHGGSHADTIDGDAGSDWLFGDSGPDLLRGGEGHDGLSGDSDGDILDGGGGADTLLGGTGDDVLNGGVGADLLLGQADNDQLHGDDVTIDTLSGGDGVNVLNDPDGNDVIDETVRVAARFNPENGQLTVLLEADRFFEIDNSLGTLHVLVDGVVISDPLGATAENVQRILVQGSMGHDRVDLTSVSREMFTSMVNDGVIVLGRAGNDTLTGSEFFDSIVGGTGNDLIDGGKDPDTIRGGAGNDTIFGGRGEDVLFGDAGNDSIVGGDNADWIDGGAGHDTLRGMSGNDTLIGGSGNDGLAGHRGDDVLNGGSGRDTLMGGDDMDTIYGGAGDDSLQGGFGVDQVNGQSGDDIVAGGSGFGEANFGDVVIGSPGEIDESFVFTALWTENS